MSKTVQLIFKKAVRFCLLTTSCQCVIIPRMTKYILLLSIFLFAGTARAEEKRFHCYVKMRGYGINTWISAKSEYDAINKLKLQYKDGTPMWCQTVEKEK